MGTLLGKLLLFQQGVNTQYELMDVEQLTSKLCLKHLLYVSSYEFPPKSIGNFLLLHVNEYSFSPQLLMTKILLEHLCTNIFGSAALLNNNSNDIFLSSIFLQIFMSTGIFMSTCKINMLACDLFLFTCN